MSDSIISVTLRSILSLCFLSFSCSLLAQDHDQKNISIYFGSDEDELDAQSKTDIRLAILDVGSENIREIYVEGHTDSDASDDYNKDLSARRAENAQQFLRKQGVKDRMIFTEYFGESHPTSDSKAQNRRVQIIFVYEIGLPAPMGNGKPILVVTTYEAVSKSHLPCNYIMEINGQNLFGRTNKSAVAIIKSDPRNQEITFVRKGYLNESIVIADQVRNVKNDTLFLDVYLRPVIVLQKLRYENIFFFTDSDELKPESKPELTNLLAMLQQDPNLYIEIQGHMNFPVSRTATIANLKYNLDLSHKRAKAVYNYLVANGISKSRLTYKGLSNFQMIYPDPQSRQQEDMNKRVEVWTLQVLANSNSSSVK